MSIAISGQSRLAALDFGRMWSDAPAFVGLGLFIALALLPLYGAMALDARLFNGQSPWMKPIKFHYALAIYLLTLAFFARYLPTGLTAHLAWRAFSLVVCLAVIGEVLWLSAAAMQNTASHFNTTVPPFIRLYPVMGALAVTLTLPCLVMGLLIGFGRAHSLEPAMRLALAAGLSLTFVATVLVAGYLSAQGGHAIGISTRQLPVLGWSRDAGDLRVAHFFATHALHAVPLAGFAAASALPPRLALFAVMAMTAAYAALIAGTFFQALAGQPFLPGIG